MSAVERLAREREAREWVAAWVTRSRDEWAMAVSRLLRVLDDECQVALTAGQNDVVGSVRNLRPTWNGLVEACVPPPRDDRAFRDALFEATLGRMVADGDLLFVSDRQRARSRFFELIHYLRHLRQRTHRHPRAEEAPELVEMVKAEVAERERPLRQKDHAALLNEIADAMANIAAVVPPTWTGEEDLNEAADWAHDVFAAFLERAFGGVKFAEFQVAATREILTAAFAGEDVARGVAVAAGTGFGKTEAFLLPLLFHALVYKAVGVARRRRGVSALLVYPRRDLCNDQAARIVGYLLHLNGSMSERWSDQFGDAQFEPLRVALAHGGAAAKLDVPCPMCASERRVAERSGTWTADDERRARLTAEPDPQERNLRGLFRCERAPDRHAEAAQCIVYQIHSDGDSADLVVTNLDTLHRRLMDSHGRKRLFGTRDLPPRLVVLDEMHIYEGQTGVHAANIVRRLRHRVRAMAEAESVELVAVGASATVFDPVDLLSRLSGISVADIVAVEQAPGQNEPQGLEYFTFLQAPGNRLQRIGTSDDEDEEDGPVGPVSERFVSEQATMIQAGMCLQHTMKTPGGTGIHKRRTLGFVDSLDLAARLARNFDNAEWQEAGPTQPSQSRDMNRAPLYLFRLPSGRPDAQARVVAQIAEAAELVRGHPPPRVNFPSTGQDCPRYVSRDCRQPPHHLLAKCPRYEAGECWYAMGLGHEEGLRPTVIQRHQSGVRSWGSPDLSFNRRTDDPNAWRLLISTSALEVGFDNPELIATWQYHAPPTVAGFLQRKGRGGRTPADRPITMMVLGTSEADVFAFQHHDRYVNVDRERDLACWIDPDNPALLRQHMVASLFDFCAARFDQTGYSVLAFEVLDRALTLRWNELVQWLVECFGVVPGRAEKLLRDFRRPLREIWMQPMVPLDVQWGDAPREPSAVFRQLKPDELRARAQMLTGDSIQIARAREWLQAMAAQKSDEFRATAPDFFAALPPWALPDNDLRLPVGTIAQPLGRDIELYHEDGANISRDPAEFALNVFLPGGFKIRFNNRLWAAPWELSPGWRPPANSQLSLAVLSVQEPERPASAVVADIRAREAMQPVANFLRERGALGVARRDELVARLGSDSDVVLVSGLKLREVGGVRSRRFTFDSALNVVRNSAHNVLQGDRHVLVRDPNLSPQREILPLRAEDQAGETVARPPFGAIRHYRRQPLLILHTSNLVHCYPQDGGERTISVHFHSVDTPGRRILPGVVVRTEALELLPQSMPLGLWRPDTIARLFWRRVGERLAQFLVVERGLLRSSYLVDGCLDALASLEERVGEFPSVPPSANALNERFAAAAQWLPELQSLAPHVQAVADALNEAADYAKGDGQDRAWAETLGAAFIRAGADRLRYSPSAFRCLVEPSDSGWRVLVFDDNEGGSGNARRLRQSLDDWTDLLADLVGRANCPVAAGDAAVSNVLNAGHSADTLSMLRTRGQLRSLLASPVEGMTLRRLDRLFEDSDLASFNLHASAVARQRDDAFGALAPLHRVLLALSQTPALDPRGEALRRRFKQGAAAELPSRLRAVRPLCVSACPYCVGSVGNNYVDRTLLAGLVR